MNFYLIKRFQLVKCETHPASNKAISLVITYFETIGVLGQPTPIIHTFQLDTSILNIGANTITVITITDVGGNISPAQFIPSPFIVFVNPDPVLTFAIQDNEVA